MSSNPRRSRSAFSLRTRLLAGQVLLLAAVCVGIGAATEVALYRYLVGQLDTQLHEVAHRSAVIHGEPPPPPPPGRRDVRSEERRVGKEVRARWRAYDWVKKQTMNT